MVGAPRPPAGADGIEVGIPFSDPVMDGPVIQEASERALPRAPRRPAILDELSRADVGVPLAVMTYVNLVYRFGYERFARHDGAQRRVAPPSCPTSRSRSRGSGARRPTPPASRR